MLSISLNDPLWIAIAFAFGLASRLAAQPPLVGFLVAGFCLNYLGAQGGELLEVIADLGITLLLFSVGLKLKLETLARTEVWGVATLHMSGITLLLAGAILLLSLLGLPAMTQLDLSSALLLGFALSFSSTVLVVKILDDLGASGALHGRVAIGVLVVQDIAAVVFIAISMGKLPSSWAIALLLLPMARIIIYRILASVGHGELLVLFGITLALLGAFAFESVGIKGDVGALVFGMLIADHPKANELSKSLLGFKELFLLGFFLSVGMSSLPTTSDVVTALLLTALLPVKAVLFFVLFIAFRLRASSSWRTSLNLANFSEFGLIVAAVAITNGLLGQEWLAILAIALSLSFVLSSLTLMARDHVYQRWQHRLKPFEREVPLDEERELDLAHIQVIVFGMGRMGTAAYDSLAQGFDQSLAGVEIDLDKTRQHQIQGRNVIDGDATNPDFWMRAPQLINGLQYVLLSLPTHQANMSAAERLIEMGYTGDIAATAKYPDEEKSLKEVGVKHTFNIYAEAGRGFAGELSAYVEENRQ